MSTSVLRRRAPRRAPRLLAAVLTATVLAAGGSMLVPGAASAAGTDVVYGTSDASLTWGLSDQATTYSAYGPTSIFCDFLSAGAAGDTGSSTSWTVTGDDGATATLPDPGYATQDGDVTILKPDASAAGGYSQPSWDDKCTDAKGATLASGASSGELVQYAGGTGTLDPSADDASISWTGSFTSVMYSGLVYWTATDPTLTVQGGKGTLTATISGYQASRTGAAAWTAVPARQVTLATLSGVTVTDTGFTVTPDFAGVELGDVTNQNTTEDGWGSWPQSFVDFQVLTGESSFWYSSGSNDTVKVPLPLTVAVTGRPLAAPASGARPTIAGAATVGKTLTAKPGTWAPADVALSYQWFADGSPIAGATSKTLKLTTAQKGARITVAVAGAEAGYVTTTVTSGATTKVAAAPKRAKRAAAA